MEIMRIAKWSEIVNELTIFNEEIPILIIYSEAFFTRKYDNGNFSKNEILGCININPGTLGYITLDLYGWVRYHHKQSSKSDNNVVDIEFEYKNGVITANLVVAAQELETVYIN
jgi:hypothetical protein